MHIVFDIGGTKMRITTSLDGKRLEQPVVLYTPPSFEEGVRLLEETILQLSQGRKIDGIAGGIAGPLDKAKTQLLNAPNLPDWTRKPLKQTLEHLLRTPVFLENDAALAGLGEAHFGEAKDKSIVVFLTISTGVGGVRIIDGKIERNDLGFEPGHQIIDPNGPTCFGCKRKGHLEAFIGGASLQRRLGKKPEEIMDQKVWDEVGYYLALGLNNVMVFWSPDIVVLGGSLMGKIDLKRVQRMLEEWCQIYPQLPPIVSASLTESGLYGALSLLTLQKSSSS